MISNDDIQESLFYQTGEATWEPLSKAKTIKVGDKEYEIENLSDQGKAALVSLQFTTSRMQELDNMRALLQRAKDSYLGSLKQEMLSAKAGLQLGND